MKTIFTFLVVTLLAVSANAAVLSVTRDGSGQYVEVQPAINAASAGDTILVGPGQTYAGFDVDRQLVIIGAGTGAGPNESSFVNGVVRVMGSADGTELRSLWIYSSQSSQAYDSTAGVLRIMSGASSILVRRCLVENVYSAFSQIPIVMYVGQFASVSVLEATIWNPSSNGGYKGIEISTGSSLLLSNCVISLSQVGYGAYSVYGGDASSSLSADHCLFYTGSGNTGLYCSASGTIMNCASYGGDLVYSAPNIVVNCCANNTSSANFVSIGSNPQTANYHLSPTSTLRDAGCIGSPFDLDSTRADIGVYGGPTPWVQYGAPAWPPFAYDLQIPLSVPQNGVMRVYSKGRVGPGQ
jgi:hypothetical protein